MSGLSLDAVLTHLKTPGGLHGDSMCRTKVLDPTSEVESGQLLNFPPKSQTTWHKAQGTVAL